MNARHLDGDEPLHAHAPTSDDAALLASLAGATFGPNASLTLPSGRRIGPDEANRWVAQGVTEALAWRALHDPHPAPPAPKPRHPVVTGLWVGIGAAAGLALGCGAGLGLLAWLGVW